MLCRIYWTGIAFTRPLSPFFLLYLILNVAPQAHAMVIMLLRWMLIVSPHFFSWIHQEMASINSP